MLSILRSLVQEVNSARDLQEALDIIVSRVQKAMGTEVCSVYLLDPATNRYILMATEGLYQGGWPGEPGLFRGSCRPGGLS